MTDDLFYTLSLKKVYSIGNIKGIDLIKKLGNSKLAFDFLINKGLVKDKNSIFREVEKELSIIKKRGINTLIYGGKNYPNNLSNCRDAPLLLYTKGDIDLENKAVVSIVGTRKPSDYGYKSCLEIIKKLKGIEAVIVSGFAEGIDICAHIESIKNNLQTLAILGHGFSTIYPSYHKIYIDKVIKIGGFATEFEYETNSFKQNFPIRNRIIAGISDATIIIESKIKGGSMITANIANSYNREVFAIPGNINAPLSKGCNYLIKNNLAKIISDYDDMIEDMNWNTYKKHKPKQSTMLKKNFNLSEEEKSILDLFNDKNYLHLENIFSFSKLNTNIVMKTILEMELKGFIKCLPGKFFEKII